MIRALRLVPGLLLAGFLLVIMSHPPVGEAPLTKISLLRSGAAAAVQPETPILPSSVRIAHEIVHVKVKSADPVRPRPAPESRQARTVVREAPPKAESRARRILFGDGTYRPEPFPRPTKN